MSFLCSLYMVSSLLPGCAPPPPLAVGYVEGEYVLLAPIEVAAVTEVTVRRGERVEAGRAVAALESGDVRIAVQQAEAALGQAQAQLADLRVGKRPEEVAVLEAAVASAQAASAEAERVLARVNDLYERGIATKAEYDKAVTAVEQTGASLRQAKANLAVAGLPARPEAIRAAESQVRQADAQLDQAKWRLGRRAVTAPAAGRINDIIRTPGDIAGPSAPVISMLPDGAVKLKLYIPEHAFATVAVGSELAVRCDGCPDGLTARVSYVSPDPEFTPPVIYSLETRQKLVYLVEARPGPAAAMLQPGQIVDVELGR